MSAVRHCVVLVALAAGACVHARASDAASAPETTRVLHLDPGVTATVVAPARTDPRAPVEMIVYALPNGNTTAQTIGQRLVPGMDWHFDIQHIGAQTRALRVHGMPNAVVVYLEAERLSWPAWRARLGIDSANRRIVGIVDSLRTAVGAGNVTLTGHSGGGSLMFGFIEGQAAIPGWITRIAYLDANYNYDRRHTAKLTEWLRADGRKRLEVVAYDDRNIMLDGKKVVSDSGGTWRATQRMIDDLAIPLGLQRDTFGAFERWRSAQVELLRHPNPGNRILHTEMIGEMNAYMHALLAGRHGYDDRHSVLVPSRAYARWIRD